MLPSSKPWWGRTSECNLVSVSSMCEVHRNPAYSLCRVWEMLAARENCNKRWDSSWFQILDVWHMPLWLRACPNLLMLPHGILGEQWPVVHSVHFWKHRHQMTDWGNININFIERVCCPGKYGSRTEHFILYVQASHPPTNTCLWILSFLSEPSLLCVL